MDKRHCVYFTRHGETIWNVKNKICGSTDIALTKKGRDQARALGEKILNEKIGIDEILYSPLSRAADTAQIISQTAKIPARAEIRLKEQNFGKYESTPRDGKEFAKAKENFIYRFDGGESMLELCARIYGVLDDVKADKEKTYLLVAHNGISRAVESYFRDMTNEEFGAFGIGNCELIVHYFQEEES